MKHCNNKINHSEMFHTEMFNKHLCCLTKTMGNISKHERKGITYSKMSH